MNEFIIERASQLLKDGYDGVIGLRKRWGHVGPYLFTNIDELKDLELEPRYPLAATVRLLQAKWPEKRLGAVLRGCDERALKRLEERGIYRRDGLTAIGVVCSQEQAEECNCEKPIYTTFDCTGCWKCIEKCEDEAITRINVCPIVVPNEFDQGLGKRKAIYIPFAQAVPLKYTLDPDHCLKLTNHFDCKGCANVCEAKSVLYEDEAIEETIEVGAILIATGHDFFHAPLLPQYNYGRFPNIIESMEFERLCSASGPTGGKVLLADGRVPESVAIIHCVGSRDSHTNSYCSRVCCMHAMKQAHLVKEKTGAQVYELYIDIRASGKGYEEFYERVQREGVLFIRGRGAEVVMQGGQLMVKAEDTGLGRPITLSVDLVILSTGMTPRRDSEMVARTFHITRDRHGFFMESHPKLRPFHSNTDGLFLAGTCQAPRDIPDSVAHANAAAAEALSLLSRGKVTIEPLVAEIDPERCSACLVCILLCPYQAISLNGKGANVAEVNEVLCKGCGVCVAACPTGAITAKHFTDQQILAQIEGVLAT